MNPTDNCSFSRRSFARRRPALLLSLCFAVSPLFAQGPFPDVASKEYSKLTDALIDILQDQGKKLPTGGATTRDNLYGILAAFWVAGISGEVITTAAGTAIGGGIGAIAAGVGAAPGAAIGFGAGGLVGMPMLMTPALLTMPAVFYIESNYPPAGGGGGMFVFDPAMPGNAGPMESAFVGMIRMLPRELVTLASDWDRMQGLPDGAAPWLRQHAFLRPYLERIAYVMRNNRMSATALPAQDLSVPFADWVRLPDQDDMQEWYLDTFGLLESKLTLSQRGKLTLSVPPALRRFVQQNAFEVNVPHVDLKVGGNGGALDPYIRLRLEPGPLAISWDKAEVVESGPHKDQIRLGWSVAKGSRLGAIDLSWKWNGPEQSLADLKPKLGRRMTGSIFLKVQGLAIAPVGFQVNDVDVDLDLPKALRDATAALKDIVTKATGDMQQRIEKLFEQQMPWAGILGNLAEAQVKSLQRRLQQCPATLGLCDLGELKNMRMADGVLSVQVTGRRLQLPKLALGQQELVQLIAGKAKARGAALRAPVRPLARGVSRR